MIICETTIKNIFTPNKTYIKPTYFGAISEAMERAWGHKSPCIQVLMASLYSLTAWYKSDA